ncbi:MAG: OmpH family outer membrane protein [Elusimicrobia bacterium]|nr:OmpH family outer membrane protein [Elusimicrobiota bacterium]
MNRLLLVSSLLLPLLAPAVKAVEVSLEENKAERGNIGYVDLQAVFKLYPGTQKAKQNFEEVVRQAEEQVNVRKLEVYRIEAELTQLRTQREFLLKNPNPAKPPQLPGMESQKSGRESRSPSAPLEVTPPAASRAATDVAASTQPASSVDASTAPASGKVQFGPLGELVPDAANAKSTRTAQLPITSLPGLMAEAAPAATSGTVSEIEARIADRAKLLEQKRAELKTYEDQVEKNLLDLESRRTEIILGKIYAAVQVVAQAEGISVVVDKSQILFGHKAVDLTPKVLEKLKGLPQ